ncbi:MAG TPA: hypothetical protein PKA63_08865 [Oligoflexia bacterium]|nr:hypothetical protein [Oligoflexia bacterium]HMP48762.1 hypothetical protein [Oligoflexia bacterium]
MSSACRQSQRSAGYNTREMRFAELHVIEVIIKPILTPGRVDPLGDLFQQFEDQWDAKLLSGVIFRDHVNKCLESILNSDQDEGKILRVHLLKDMRSSSPKYSEMAIRLLSDKDLLEVLRGLESQVSVGESDGDQEVRNLLRERLKRMVTGHSVSRDSVQTAFSSLDPNTSLWKLFYSVLTDR